MKLVGFTTVNGNPVYINPKYVAAIHQHGINDSEINLMNGINVKVRNKTPRQIGELLVTGQGEG